MTVQTVPSRELSAEDKREYVLAYLSTPHGLKGPYLREHGIIYSQLAKWRAALADGDLDRGLVPRHTGQMSKADVAEVRRLQKRNIELENELERANLDLERQRMATDALGKAIGVMQKLHGADSDEDASR